MTMMRTTRILFGALCLTALQAAPATGQDAAAVRAELAAKIDVAGQKFIALAGAMPQETFTWRPGDGVRSSAEVFMHVAGTNYWFPAIVGGTPPAATGITATYATVRPMEEETDKEVILETLRASFDFLVDFVRNAPPDRLDEAARMFGQSTTYRDVLVETTTHLHEHLGQAIAYARVNGVVPPWSR